MLINSAFRNAVLGATALALCATAQASQIYLDISGSHASGDVNGVAFTDKSWTFEYQIDSATPPDQPYPNGWINYSGGITGGTLRLDGNTYTLSGGSQTGLLSFLNDGLFGGTNIISINPDYGGGFIQFVTGYGYTFPVLFNDASNLASANPGATVSDTTTDAYNNSSALVYKQSCPLGHAKGGGQPICSAGVLATDGVEINISESNGVAVASGDFSVTVSDHAMLSGAPVPEPASLALLSLGLLGLGFSKRKKA